MLLLPHVANAVFPGADPATTTLASKFNASSATGIPQRVQVTPTQLHFHTRSEHLLEGRTYPLELHIVNFVYNNTLPGCGAGCATVVGVLLEETDDESSANPFLTTLFDAMPYHENVSKGY